MSDLQAKVNDLENQNKQLQNLVIQFRAQIKQLSAEKNSLDNSYGELFQSHHKVKTTVFLNQEDLQEKTKEVLELKRQLTEANNKIVELQKKPELHAVEDSEVAANGN